jgi:hypothetical protein
MNESNTFMVHHLRFEVEAVTPLALPPPAGPKLRAALYGALGLVCPLGGDANAPPEHKAVCPVCWLLATEKPGDQRGKDLPRPLTIEPPLELPGIGDWRLRIGERFSFGLSLFAQAANLFPYLALGVPEMGRRGLGRRLPALGGRRGQFALRRAEATNPLTGQRQDLFDAAQGALFQTPSVPVTAEQVATASERMAAMAGSEAEEEGELALRFLTPTRVISGGELVHAPLFPPLFARLFDRLGALSRHYGDATLAPREAKPELMALADRVRLAGGEGTWKELRSHSRRLGRATPVSGFVGRAVYAAPVEVWRRILPPLLWGQSTHVGKNATKGFGWYEVQIGGNHGDYSALDR